jgi:hypothetical protein
MVHLRDTFKVDDERLERRVIPDRRSVRVPLELMDGRAPGGDDLASHRPGFRTADAAASAEVRTARQEMIDRAASAWRDARKLKPDDPEDPDDPDDPDEDDDEDTTDSRSVYVRALADAWRRGPVVRDAVEPDNSSAAMRRHLSGEPDDGAQARKDRAWAKYRDDLASAWKRGAADPAEAARVERIGERTRGGR